MLEASNIYRDAINKALADVHTSMPGKILSYNDESMTATVELGLKRKYKGKESTFYPLIDDVPVVLPVFKTCQMRPPVSEIEGGTCLVIFAERSLDDWLNGDGEPKDGVEVRRFALSDAIAIPGLSPDSLRPKRATDPESFEISRGKSFLAFKSSGGIELKRDGNELFKTLQDLCDILLGIKTNTGIGPQPFEPGSLEKLKQLQSKFKTMTS